MKLNFLNVIKQKFKNKSKRAFSLNDLSVLMSTVAIVAVSSVAISNIQNSEEKEKADSEKIEAIYKSIGSFLLEKKRLPCPAGIERIRGTDVDYGAELINADKSCGSQGGVYSLTIGSKNNPAGNLLYGTIPTQALGLTSDFAQDQYGTKIVYIVDKRATNIDTIGAIPEPSAQNPLISIKENNVVISSDSIFAILTVGKDKQGGFNYNSSTFNALPTNSNEADNSFLEIDTASKKMAMSDYVFVKSINTDSTFNDILFSKDRNSLINDYKADFLIPCRNAGSNYQYVKSNNTLSSDAVYGQILYSNQACAPPNSKIIPAKKCGRDGNWIYYTSCPCWVEANGIEPKFVPNGEGSINCTNSNYDGILKYNCSEVDFTATILQNCKMKCSFAGAPGINSVEISDGVNKLTCDQPGYKGEYIIACTNGIITDTQGGCKSSICSVIGGYSGMFELTNVPSESSSTSGSCQSGYSGSYSYTCSEGVSTVNDFCYADCNVSAYGIAGEVDLGGGNYRARIKHGNSEINCRSGYLGGKILVSCVDGASSIKSGFCYQDGKCTVGIGLGMTSLSVQYNTSGNGACAEGFGGNYTYTCSTTGKSTTVNNCIPLNCSLGNVDGMKAKTANAGSSGTWGQSSVGECSLGYGGYYSWNCSSSGVGNVVVNNCKNSCVVGTVAQGGEGMVQTNVGFGLSGEGQCDEAAGYNGKYSWTCSVNPTSGLVEGAVTKNDCRKYCIVGTVAQAGAGMKEANVAIGTSGNGECATGYGGYYKWSCDKFAFGSVSLNQCKNKCTVGQGLGMVAKNVDLGTSSSIAGNPLGTCDSTLGYEGNYSWSCSASADALTTNNCTLKKCTIPATLNRNLRSGNDVVAGKSGNDGTCKEGYYGSFSWYCSTAGIGSVTKDNCAPITCKVPAGITGFVENTTIAYGNRDYYCNADGYSNMITANFNCSANPSLPNSAIGVFSAGTSNYCTRTQCLIAPGSNLTISDWTYVDYTTGTTTVPVNCKSGFATSSGATSTTYRCKEGNLNIGTYSQSASCNAISCTISGTGYKDKSLSGSGTFTCDKGYSGTIAYACTGATTANTSGTCAPVSCTISGFGYASKPLSGSGTFNCDAGYSGTIAYACTGATSADTSGTCVAIKCSSPSAYNGLSLSALSNLAFAPANSPGSVTCNQTGYTGTASYTCIGTTNPGIFALTSSCACASGYELNSLTQACGVTQCNTTISGFITGTAIPYSTTPKSYYCNDPVYDNLVTTTFQPCTSSTTLNPASSCVKITCSTASLNVTVNSIFIGNSQSLNCATGYYSPTSITTNCIAVNANRTDTIINPDGSTSNQIVSVPNTGTLSGTSGTCTRIKCKIPLNSNLTISDGTPVDFTTSSVGLNCATGFASSLGATNPSYTCMGNTSATGTYSQNGSCNAIKCTSTGFGYSAQNSLDYAIASSPGSITCTQAGYTGNANYTCTANGSATITKACDCDATNGYSRNSPAEACVKVQCSIPSGYNLSVAAGSKVDFTTGTTTGTINCANGFYNSASFLNSVTYTCKIGTGTSGNYVQTGQCVAVKCPFGLYSYLVNEGATMNIASQYGLIKEIKFASYGTPYGDPWQYYTSGCHSTNYSSLNKCLNSASCSVVANNDTFGDPCQFTVKQLIVQYRYEIPGITGVTSVDFGNGSLNCSNGYSGTVNYTCDQNRLMKVNSGTCNAIVCTAPANYGYGAQNSLTYTQTAGSGNITCDLTGYTGNANYTCQTQGAVATINKGCDCAIDYTKDVNGACVAIKCSSSGNGYLDQNNLSYTQTGTNGFISCTQTGYTGFANYTCQSQGSATITKGCDCATGYAKNISGVCEKIQCKVPNGSNLTIADGTSLDFTASGTLNCKSGFLTSTNSSTVTYSCSAGGGGAVGTYVQNGTCASITCNASSANGYGYQSSLAFTPTAGSGTISCNLPGYTGTVSYTCSANGPATVGSTCACDSTNGYARNNIADACSLIQCSVPASVNANETLVNFTSSASLTCKSGFVSSLGATNPTYKCVSSGSGTTGTYTSLNGNCTEITCVVPTGITGFVAGTTGIIFGSVNYNCNAPGYYNNYTANFKCEANGTSSTGKFSVVNNYCTAIPCTISGTGYKDKPLSGAGTFTCDQGYSGTIAYACKGATTADTSGTCNPISCIISGFGYASKPLSGSGTFNCDAGYSGTIAYACTGATSADTSGTCVAIKCSSPSAYNGLSLSALSNLAFAPANSPGSVTCNQTGYTGTASYTCIGTTNPGIFALTSSCACASGYELNSLTQACGVTQCNTTISGFITGTAIPYSTTPKSYYCNDPVYDNLVTTTFQPCTSSTTLNPASSCVKITCSTASLNVTVNSIFIGNSQSLNCATGYYSPTSITTNCIAVNANRTDTIINPDGSTSNQIVSVPNTGTLSGTSGTCTRIKCKIPLNSNLTISDGTPVDFTTSSVGLNCATGFASSLGATNPSYTCMGNTSATGTYSQNGSCNAITCTAPANYGYGAQSSLAYTPSVGSGTIACNLTGYTGNANYTCQTQGAVANITKACGCATGYVKDNNGACVAITCNAPAANGYDAKTGLAFTASGTIACNLTGYTGSANYSCSGTANPGTFTSLSNCACATGYSKDANGVCIGITCPVNLPGISNTSVGLGTGILTCGDGYSGKVSYECTCDKIFAYNDRNYLGVVYGYVVGKYNYCLSQLTNGNDMISSFKIPSGLRVTIYQHCTSTDPYGATEVFTANSATIPSLDNNASGLLVERISACTSGLLYNSTSCGPITCTVPAGTGYASRSVSGVGSFACDAGYSGTINYSCSSTSSVSVTGSCASYSCTIPAGTGFTSKSVTGSGSFDCDVVGYAGTINYTCTSSTTSTKTGTCSPITCTIPTGISGFNSGAVIQFGTNQILNCNATGYLTTSTATFSCGANGTSATGIFSQVSNSCTPITCTANDVVGATYNNKITVNPGEAEFAYYNGNLNIDNRMFGSNKFAVINRIKFYDVYEGPMKYNSKNDSWTIYSSNGITYDKFPLSAFTQYFRVGSYGWYSFRSSFIFSSDKALDYGTTSFNCDEGYSGTLTYNCATHGSQVSPTGTCTPISCTIPAGIGYASRSGSGVSSFACDAGYSGTINYTCTSATTATVSGTCTAITCSAPAANGYSAKTSLPYAPAGSGNIACDASSIYSGNANYTCTTSGVATITKTCDCASNYIKNSSGVCISSVCPINIAGISQTTIPLGSNDLNCNVAGYEAGTLNYNCAQNTCYVTAYINSYYTGSSANYLPGTYYYPLSIGNDAMSSVKIPTGLQLTLYQDDIGSSSKILTSDTSYFSGLTFASGVTLDNNASALVVTQIGDCFRFDASSTGSQATCTPITCTNLSGYKVNYAPSATNITCGSGYVSSLGAVSPTYTCTGITNPGTYSQNGTCIPITCTIPANITGFIEGTVISSGYNVYNCNARGYRTSGVTAGFTCSANGTSTTGIFSQNYNNCIPYTCTISGTGYTSKMVTGTGTFTCDPAFAGTVSYMCTSTTTADIYSNTCAPVTCSIPAGVVGFVEGTIIAGGYNIYNCNAPGYRTSGVTAGFTCVANGLSTTGIFSQNYNNCIPI